MQQIMHSYVCGINLRSEKSLVLSDLVFAYNRCTRIRQEHVYLSKSKYDLMRILSELIFIPQNIGIHRPLHDIPRFFIFFIEQLYFSQMLSIGSFGRREFCGKEFVYNCSISSIMSMTILPAHTVVFGVGICNAKVMLTTENRGILSLVSSCFFRLA